MYIPKPPADNKYEIPPAGTHVATCYRVIDRGTQMTEFNNDRRTRHEVMLSWELSDELMSDGRPFSVSKIYTLSMHKKASLRRDLEAWRGLAFSEADFEGPQRFNMKNLLGASCLLTIAHDLRPDGDVFAKATGVGKLVKGMMARRVVNEIVYLSLEKERWDPGVFMILSDRMKEVIASSPEYQDLNPDSRPPSAQILDDDIPF